MALISIQEYAQKNGKAQTTVRQKAAAGGFETARKIGRNWVIEEDEPYLDNRIKTGKYRICTLFYESILYTKKIVETAREIKKIYEDSTCYDTPQILDVCLSTVSNKNPTIQVTNLDETGIEERFGVEHNTVGFRESYDKKYIDIDGLEVFELVKKIGVN